MTQSAEYAHWRNDPEGYWFDASQAISWVRRPQIACDVDAKPAARWFVDGVVNACYNAVDRHVEAGFGDQTALIYVSAMTGEESRFSYAELLREVALFAGALRKLGVESGDRVVIYMPMVPQAVIAMLACARIGAIHSVVFGGFAARELAARIDDATPKIVLSASCGLEPNRVIDYHTLLDRALALATHRPKNCVIWQRPQAPATLVAQRDLDWAQCLTDATPVDCVPMPSPAPLYILYTSGTTGKPKGVVRDTGGYLVALAWSMQHVYDVSPGDTFWAASDIGWVVGHSYIVYGPLVQGCTTLLYEGKPVGTPDAGAYWRIASKYRVAALFTAPTAMRAIKRDDPDGSFVTQSDLSKLRTVFLAGERADPNTVRWAGEKLGVPVIDHWWQTETGWPVVANCVGLGLSEVKPGSPTRPVPGFALEVHGTEGRIFKPNVQGALLLKLPLPPGCLTTLWNDADGFERAYLRAHPGYYTTGDGGYVDADGYVYVMGRLDDVINVAGHRLSTGELEQAIAGHPAVAECAVIGAADALKGTVPLGFAVLKMGVTSAPDLLARELVARVRDEVGAVAGLHRCVIVTRLPKTRSGKVLRSTLRAIVDRRPYEVPATIEDPAVLEEIRAALGL